MSDLMNFGNYAQFLFALIFVLGLIGLFSLLLKRLSMTGIAGLRNGRGPRRLSIVETVMIDGKRRMVLIRRDNKEHLLMLGQQTDLLIESGIEAADVSDLPTNQDNREDTSGSPANVATLGADIRRLLRGEKKRASQ